MNLNQRLIIVSQQQANELFAFDHDSTCLEEVKTWDNDIALAGSMERIYRHLNLVNGKDIYQANKFVVQLNAEALEVEYNLALNRLMPLQDRRSEMNDMDDDTYYKYIIDQYLIPFTKCLAAVKNGKVVYYEQY